MIRPACVYRSLLPLLVLGQQLWEAEAEVHAGAHDLVRSEQLVHNYSIGGKLKEMDTVDKDFYAVETEKLNLNLSSGGAGGESTPNSSRAALPCPDSAAIAPCVCTVDANSSINLDCTLVESEEQLEAVFQQEFPVKELYQFSMDTNCAITVLGNILIDVSFEKIVLSPGPFALQHVSDYFILASRLTLSYLDIRSSALTSTGFPFAMLDVMEALTSLEIRTSSFTWIPRINSPTIRKLLFSDGSIASIEPGTFDDVTNLNFLDLSSNSLTELRAGTVPIREGPMTFHGSPNYIQVVYPGAFFFPDASSTTSSGGLGIYLSNNGLQSLQAGTFPLRNAPVTIYLYSNQIASIEPGTFFLPEATGTASSGQLTIILSYNELRSLQAGTFPLRNSPVIISLVGNQIASIEPGTFFLPKATDSFGMRLWFTSNKLTTFDEAVFGDLMPFIADLRLFNNPLTCGCDIVWLISYPTFAATVDYWAQCANGTYLHDLDPQGYDVC